MEDFLYVIISLLDRTFIAPLLVPTSRNKTIQLNPKKTYYQNSQDSTFLQLSICNIVPILSIIFKSK